MADDGSFIALADNQMGDDAPARIPGAYRIVAGETGPASVEPIAGTEIDNTLKGRYLAVAAGPDGIVALARFGNEQISGEQVVQLFDATPAAGPISVDAPIALARWPFTGRLT